MTTAWVPESCTLPTAEQPLRVAEFDGVLATAVAPPRRVAPGRLEVVLAAEVAATTRGLVARETACCSFFTFTLNPCPEGVELIVEVPAAHVAVLDGMQRRIEAARAGL
ncbi:MAG: hypothetical protein QOK35_2620 [Pseudonocardiales bacterium]|jgi:hypothetical protein|nr:hypothetical protein [Pseudonocardiales bacterium]